MKYIRIFLFSLFLMPVVGYAAAPGADFMIAAQLLSAAKNADIQQVQNIINNGADVNFVDSTGLSIVCTALMNNDIRAAQILQMYGADASQCDRQIKNYRAKQSSGGSGGLFSGLSSAHTLTLAAAGAAVVVGGLLLFTNVFDPDNGNDNGSSGSGDRPGGGDNGGGNSLTAAFTVPYGPAMPTAELENKNYAINLDLFSTGETYADDFALMSGENSASGGNYMLMMHGYSPWARGYLGMRTLRYADRSPVPSSVLGNYKLGGLVVGGDRPVGVALVTANGANAAPKPVGSLTAEVGSLDDNLMLWSTLNGTTVADAQYSNLSSKYYNNTITLGDAGAQITNAVTAEDDLYVNTFDLSGHSTAINNAAIEKNSVDDLLVKVVGGAASGYAGADYLGFVPNGQMAVFRTGNGRGLVALQEAVSAGAYIMAGEELANDDTLVLDGVSLNISRNGNLIEASNDTVTYKGYIGVDGNLYLGDANGEINAAYQLADGTVTQIKKVDNIDYMNYRALANAFSENAALTTQAGGRSAPDVVANASVIAPLRSNTAATMRYFEGLASKDEMKLGFLGLVDTYYNNQPNDNLKPSDDAAAFFGWLGRTSLVDAVSTPLVVFSTGAYETDSNYLGDVQYATFENAAPVVFDNLEHQFMSVVAVGLRGGTQGATGVDGYTPSGKYTLAQWRDTKGTDVTTDDEFFKARICGVAGAGANGVDPWCFAAAGLTDEMAVSSAAGAAGAVKSAFSYMSNKQIFSLLALTADGAYLGTDSKGAAFTTETLASYLQNMYELPTAFDQNLTASEYLNRFKEFFGYGLINLERATTPNKSVFYYDGTNIVSASGNAYWRAAANTNFRASAAFSPRAATISAPFFDVLESVDGELSMPRVWENEFAISNTDTHGLYMGDVLGELRTRKDVENRTSIGNVSFTMAMSERPYADNLSGLDYMAFDYQTGAWNMAAGYQRYLTDGANRFAGRNNPILGLATNAITTDSVYNMGRWSFGARAFTGTVSDENLLENDPTLAAQYMPARLGLISGAQASTAWQGDKFGFNTTIGRVRESDTLLGAQTSGLLSLGAGDTTYVDTEFTYAPTDWLTLSARATFAQTVADASGAFIMGVSDIASDAFAFGVDAGNFGLTVAAPLAVSRGNMKYAYADYDIVDGADGNFDLVVRDTHIENIDLRPSSRELRISAEYRHSFGEYTDGAVGFVYRINPNHTDVFGDEGIVMMKMSHRIGI